MSRVVCWFSSGAASAVATKLLLAQCGEAEVRICRIHVPEEDEDNVRFAADCEAWFRHPISVLRSVEYTSCEDLWEKRRYMSGPKGAICTGVMKKAVRFDFQDEWQPDQQVFGFTVEERSRADRMVEAEPGMGARFPLIEAGLSKDDCFAIIQRAGLHLPRSYHLGFPNANCVGCVKDQSPRGWNRTRRHYPEVFERRAKLSRALGVRLVKLTTGARERIFLDELDPNDNSEDGAPTWDCTIMCATAEAIISNGATP